MAKVLSKYTKSTDLTQNIEYSSYKEYIEALSNNPKLIPNNDAERPYSFKQWYSTRNNLIPGSEYELYNLYLTEWYETRKTFNTATSIDTQESYLNILNQLRTSFKDELVQNELTLNDIGEMVNQIPNYAKKVKDIAKYFINKRESIRKAKLKYNMSGTSQGLERLFYEYLLKAFTKNEINDVVTTNFPELSTSQNLNISIEELYDDNSYFDRDPKEPVSTYFSYTDTTSAYLNTISEEFNSEEIFEWLYNTGVSQICANNPILWAVDDVLRQYTDDIPLSAVDDIISNTLNDYNKIKLAQKYIGADQFIISGGYYITPSSILSMELSSGNNWFYWPRGQSSLTVDNSSYIDIPINESTILDCGAIAASARELADNIFVYRDGNIEGAWLQSPNVLSYTITMSADFKANDKTEFVFPYPGYGLIGDNLPWTGRQYDNIDKTFYFLDKDQQNKILLNYWKDKLSSNNSISSISIHNTNLINCGASAHSSESIIDADVVIIRPNFNDSLPIHYGSLKAAWLYKFHTTNININEGDNFILWPYEQYTQNSQPLLENTNLLDACFPIGISAISANVISANDVSEADVIYKINTNGDIISGVWLSGNTFVDLDGVPADLIFNAGDHIKYVRQQGTFNITLELSGNYDDFPKPIWYKAEVDRVLENDYKGYDIWSGNIIPNYEISDIVFNADQHVEYFNKGDEFIWVQDVDRKDYDYENPEWKRLNIEIIDNILSVTGTNETSDIIFSTNPYNPQRINYYAVNGFTWNQPVIDSTLGLPPTGGTWVPIVTSRLINAYNEYTHLTNRHYPTYAAVPYIDNIYSSKDSGGYMVPKNLGISTALSKNNYNILNRNPISLSSIIYQDLDTYNTDVGLTNIFQYTPVSTLQIDSEWMKSQFVEGERSGIIKEQLYYQEFIPYQTLYEIHNKNIYGILQQQDKDNYTNICTLQDNELIYWDIDIFGNQYGLYEISEV